MSEKRRYDSYPMWMVALSIMFSFSIYAIGAYVLWKFIPLVSVLYLAYCAILEVRVLRHSCTGCYYYGRTCCFGKGRLSPLLFKKRDPREFAEREASWRDILPDFMVTVIPLIGGAVLLATEFSWVIAVLLLVLFVLGFPGSAFIRGSCACRYCRQRDLGCPAVRLFEKGRSERQDEDGSQR
jgi:hypothetical protein